jgi:hypothetical protein
MKVKNEDKKSIKKDLRYLRKMTPRSVNDGKHGKYGMSWIACRSCGGKFTANLPSGKVGCVNCIAIWVKDETDKPFDDWRKHARPVSQGERDLLRKWAEKEMEKEKPSRLAIELTKPRG